MAMKRSEVNQVIREMEEVIRANGFHLPPFASWTPEEWKTKGHECDEIRDNMLGWDITDFGRGDFEKCGLGLITIRNGNLKMHDKYKKPYAEKLLLAKEGQITPFHFHWHKMEDLINRGGGVLEVTLYSKDKTDPKEGIDYKADVVVYCDGVRKTFPAGYVLELKPGQSVTMTQGMYHQLCAKPGTGSVLIGEVSQTNDDNTDNKFAVQVGRFPKIMEDEPPYRLLCNEYPAAAADASKL